MKKIIIKLLILIGLISTIFVINTNAALDISQLSGTDKITGVTSNTASIKSDPVEAINDFGFNILRIAKIILQGLLFIYIVYIGGKMIMSMGSDDAELTKAKSQIWYSLIAIVFINVPGVLYQAIYNENTPGTIGNRDGSIKFLDGFFDKSGILADIISAIQVFIFIIAVYIMVMAGIKMMTSRGRDEKVKEVKEKILYSGFAMIFVGFIEAWKQVLISGKMSGGAGSATYIFGKTIDIALLFAAPVAMIFLTYAGYIYITSNGDDEKVKKAKSIIINTLIGTVLLLMMATFLNDLITL